MKCPKCGADLSKYEPETTYLRETKLDQFTEEQRVLYIQQILQSLAEAITKIKQTEGVLNQAKLAMQLWDELAPALPTLLYAIKPEFRPHFIQVLTALAQT